MSANFVSMAIQVESGADTTAIRNLGQFTNTAHLAGAAVDRFSNQAYASLKRMSTLAPQIRHINDMLALSATVQLMADKMNPASA